MARSDLKRQPFNKTGYAGVFTATTHQITAEGFPLSVEGRPVTAYAFDPEDPHRIYFTTLSPSALEFLDVPWFEPPAE